jgi:hypothetical protein
MCNKLECICKKTAVAHFKTVSWHLHGEIGKCRRIPLILTLVIRIADYPDRLGPSGKFVENSTKLTFLEITGDQIKYGIVLWLVELQIRRGRKV